VADEQGRGVALDAQGRAYVAGYTSATSFPSRAAPEHGVDVYAARFDASGSDVDYLYWFNALALFKEDEGYSAAHDAQGNLYVTGYTRSEDFCTVFGVVPGYQLTFAGETDAFVLKIRADGSGLDYCTFLGGDDTDIGRAIAVDALGNAYVAGGSWSTDFPTTPNAVQGELAGLRDIFLARLSANGQQLTYSTFLGGAGQEEASALELAAENGALHTYVAGWTFSSDFPVTAGVVGPSYQGQADGFLVKLDIEANTPGYATYLGGAGDDRPTGVGVGCCGRALVAGYTQSVDFPTTAGALAPASAGGVDGFAALLTAAGDDLEWSTYLGGAGDDQAWGLALGDDGTALLAGETASADFPSRRLRSIQAWAGRATPFWRA
jgi:hypothetical protein